MTRVLFEPHADDAVLFAAFTILRYRPQIVITCMESLGDYGHTDTRHAETRDAMAVLGATGCMQWYKKPPDDYMRRLEQTVHPSMLAEMKEWARNAYPDLDLQERMRRLDVAVKPSLVFAPNRKASHPDHVAVAEAAVAVFGDRLRTYHTYDANGKVRDGREAECEPEWMQAKLRALERSECQIRHPSAHAFFVEDLREYLGD